MKTQLLTILLASSLVMTACSNDKEPIDQSETTIKVTDTKSLIKAAKSVSKDVTSYSSKYKNEIDNDKETSIVDFRMMTDEQNNQKISIKNNAEDATFYVYDKKTIIKQDDQWLDASTYVGTQMISQTEPLLYNSQFKLIDQLDTATYKEGDGYTLTETFDDYEKYKALFGNTKENKQVITELEKEYPDISGKITVTFNEAKQIDHISNQLTLKNDQSTVVNNAVTTFDKINEIKKLDIPEAVKAAKSIEE